MVKRAIIIGMNYYDHPNMSLRGCVNDAYNMYSYLIKHRGYDMRNITMMTDESHSADNYPSRDNIIKAIRKIIEKMVTGDSVFMHVSSHGTEIQDKNGDEVDGKDSAIVTADVQLLSDDELKLILVDQLPQGCKLRVFLDLCHSGTALDLPFNYVGGKYTQESADCKQSSDCLMLSGTYDAHVSYDAKIGGQFAGVFTHDVLRIMVNSPTITWVELLNRLQQKIAKEKYDQIPQLSLGDKSLISMPIDL